MTSLNEISLIVVTGSIESKLFSASITRFDIFAVSDSLFDETLLSFSFILASKSPNKVNILLANNLSLLSSLPMSGLAREITFIRNGTLMLVAVYQSNNIVFYDVYSPANYSSVPSLVFNISSPCGLYAVNDSFVYIASWTTSSPISTLIFSNNIWTLASLPNTLTSSSERTFQTTVDSCGRLWMSITGYGIRIFDPWGNALLFSWPLSNGLDGILLLDDYELFLADYGTNRVLHFKPNIGQCTS